MSKADWIADDGPNIIIDYHCHASTRLNRTSHMIGMYDRDQADVNIYCGTIGLSPHRAHG